jgi:NTP pyrophosphatase (non-canonical NTP hydrolase)
MDQATNLQELKKVVVEFRDERDWRKYDTPKNLAISISIEAAELLEHFQWKTDVEVDEMSSNPQKRREVSDELADVMIYCLGFADMLKIDVAEALKKKLEKTSEKYPALKSSTL